MNTDYRLTSDPSYNRKVLKRFIKNNAKKFDMGTWLVTRYGGHIPQTYVPSVNEVDVMQTNPENAIEAFEECGTSCCIAGAMRVLSGVDSVEDYHAEHLFGLPNYTDSRAPYLATHWPPKIYQQYRIGQESGDPVQMAKAGLKAIDHFAKELA
jgi:hypothetical protein